MRAAPLKASSILLFPLRILTKAHHRFRRGLTGPRREAGTKCVCIDGGKVSLSGCFSQPTAPPLGVLGQGMLERGRAWPSCSAFPTLQPLREAVWKLPVRRVAPCDVYNDVVLVEHTTRRVYTDTTRTIVEDSPFLLRGPSTCTGGISVGSVSLDFVLAWVGRPSLGPLIHVNYT